MKSLLNLSCLSCLFVISGCTMFNSDSYVGEVESLQLSLSLNSPSEKNSFTWKEPINVLVCLENTSDSPVRVYKDIIVDNGPEPEPERHLCFTVTKPSGKAAICVADVIWMPSEGRQPATQLLLPGNFLEYMEDLQDYFIFDEKGKYTVIAKYDSCDFFKERKIGKRVYEGTRVSNPVEFEITEPSVEAMHLFSED